MTASNNGKAIALVILIVILALFAFRSVFILLPFGVLPGASRAAGEIGPSISGWFHGFGAIGRYALFILPAALIILWGAVLLWVYRDAERRGMSGILWLLLVLVGNIIGLLVYVIVRSETSFGRRAAPGGGPKDVPPAGPGRCPHCGNPVAPDYAYCPHCGKGLRTVCPACGKPVVEGWKACPACGARLDPSSIRDA
jgi:hypothetical protein